MRLLLQAGAGAVTAGAGDPSVNTTEVQLSSSMSSGTSWSLHECMLLLLLLQHAFVHPVYTELAMTW